jgi:hypothetical protein
VTLAVLTYHSHNVFGTGYAGNDHVALAADLEMLQGMGAQIVPLEEIAALVRSPRRPRGAMVVGISFDDGPVFDFADFDHPVHGRQRGFLPVLRDFRERHGAAAQPRLHATSFVIASPEARRAMERDPSAGYGFVQDWLSEDWWAPAVGSGLIGIGNHSWDHVHHSLATSAVSSNRRDDFTVVDNFADAELEIRAASQYIGARVRQPCTVFAFPFGHVNDYLVREYLPAHGPDFGLVAAFGTGGLVSPDASPWSIPRVVCGHHWHSPAELRALLEG